MDIDVTAFVNSEDMYDFAHSEAEHCGAPGTAGSDTWKAALAAAERYPLVTEANRDAFESWCGDFGAWTREEIVGWTLAECTAILLQFVAGDAREMMDAAEGECGAFDAAAFAEYMENRGGSLYCEDPTADGAAWSFYMGH